MEEITRVQKGYAIPDAELRGQLKQDNKEYVLPFYRQFRKRYEGTNFSKNPEKYIKYSERDIVSMIDQFFDSTAWWGVVQHHDVLCLFPPVYCQICAICLKFQWIK